MVDRCRLCLRPAELSRSHIIPEFLYREIFDETRRAVSPDPTSGREPLVQTGIWEKMLCAGCEGDLGELERQFKACWSGQLPAVLSAGAVHLSELPYATVKRFHISVLWRAAATHRQEFDQVRLGPHEGRLRKVILEGAVPTEDEYPIVGVVIVHPDTREVFRQVMPHARAKIDGIPTYCASFAGCAWYYPVSSHASPFERDVQLRASGTLALPVMTATQFPPLQNFVRRVRDAQQTTR